MTNNNLVQQRKWQRDFFKRIAIRKGIDPSLYTEEELAQIGRKLYYPEYFMKKAGVDFEAIVNKLKDLTHRLDVSEDTKTSLSEITIELEDAIRRLKSPQKENSRRRVKNERIRSNS